MTESKIDIPKRLLVIAVIFVLLGLEAVYDSIVALIFSHNLNINLSWLLLPIGMGLYLGKELAVMWAKISCIGVYLVVAVMVVLVFSQPGMIEVKIFDQTYLASSHYLYAIFVALLCIAITGFVHIQLYHHKVVAYVHSKINPHTRARLDRLRKRAKQSDDI